MITSTPAGVEANKELVRRREQMAPSGDVADERFYTAGQVAPPGRYRRVDGVGERVVVLERADRLPGSPVGTTSPDARGEWSMERPVGSATSPCAKRSPARPPPRRTASHADPGRTAVRRFRLRAVGSAVQGRPLSETDEVSTEPKAARRSAGVHRTAPRCAAQARTGSVKPVLQNRAWAASGRTLSPSARTWPR